MDEATARKAEGEGGDTGPLGCKGQDRACWRASTAASRAFGNQVIRIPEEQEEQQGIRWVKRLQESQAWVTQRAGVRKQPQYDAAQGFALKEARGAVQEEGRDFGQWTLPRQRLAAGVKPAMRCGCVKGSRSCWGDRG